MEYTLFPDEIGRGIAEQIFIRSELGQIYENIPFKVLADKFRKKESFVPSGRKPIFTIEGGLGLMFLKHYLKLSDRMLVDRINSDPHLQLFCGKRLSPLTPVRDKDIVGRWRRFFAEQLDIDSLQLDLAQYWKRDLENTQALMDDATCYESAIKYPTDVKLLFDCSEWLQGQLLKISKAHGLACPRFNHYYELRERVIKFQRLRRKPAAKRKRLLRSLLLWVDKWQHKIQAILNKGKAFHVKIKDSFYTRLKTIRIIYTQQYYMFETGVHKVKHRIVSLYKPYLRPIVRGKERKRVEFGAKVNMSQVDGLNFIEHLNFEAFHEGNRMWQSIARHKKHFGSCKQYAGDQIYATNRNRRKATKLKLQTSFKRKGRAAKDEVERKKMRSILSKERSTRLEGSFGTEKQHYLLGRVRARLEVTEVAWIFFTIHTANVVRLTRRKMLNKARGSPALNAA